MKVLVTGAAGFIGSNLVLKLYQERVDFKAIDALLDDSYSSEIKVKNWQYVESRIGKSIPLNIINLLEADFQSLLEDCTHIVHLAAIAGQNSSWGKAKAFWENNVIATQLLVENAVRNDVKIIFASSSSVYGNNAVGNELQACNPISPYGVTKFASEKIIEAYDLTQSSTFKSTSLRFFSVYGPMQRPDMGIHKFIDSLIKDREIVVFGDGSAQRSLTFVEDIVECICLAIKNPSINGKFNVCGDQSISVLEIITQISSLFKKKPKITHTCSRIGDQMNTTGDSTLAQSAFGFKPKTTIELGLRLQVEWQKELNNFKSSSNLEFI